MSNFNASDEFNAWIHNCIPWLHVGVITYTYPYSKTNDVTVNLSYQMRLLKETTVGPDCVPPEESLIPAYLPKRYLPKLPTRCPYKKGTISNGIDISRVDILRVLDVGHSNDIHALGLQNNGKWLNANSLKTLTIVYHGLIIHNEINNVDVSRSWCKARKF